MLVKDIMSNFVIMVDEQTNLREIARKMRDHDVGCLLVYTEDNLSGIVTDRDITCKGVVNRDSDVLTAADIMSKDIIWCKENENIEDAIRLMENNQIKRLPVLDEDMDLVGILTLGDVSTHLSHELAGEVVEAISSSANKICPTIVN